MKKEIDDVTTNEFVGMKPMVCSYLVDDSCYNKS